MLASVEVHAPDLPPARFVLGEEPIRIGRACGATFCPRASERLGDAILVVDPRADACHVTLAGDARATIAHGGTEHRSVRVPWGDEIFVSSIRFAFVLESTADRSPSPVVVIAALCVAVSAVAWLASDQGAPTTDAEPPSLAVEATPCPIGPALAAREGAAAEAIARSKGERYPFVRSEGPEALRQLNRAAACYSIAGRAADARRAGMLAVAMLHQIEADYAALRARLRLTVARRRWSEAAWAASSLGELLVRHPDHEYVAWLSRMERDMRQRVER
jgi:hypothetical protein